MANAVQLDNFTSVQGEWEALLPRCSTNTLFVTPQWLRIWWEHFGHTAYLVLTHLRHNDQLIGIAPLMRRENTLSFIGDSDLFDYHDFPVAQGYEEEAYSTLVQVLEQEEWQTLDLTSIPQGSPTLAHLPSLFRQRGYAVTLETEDVAPGVHLPESWDEYLGTLRKKDRHEFRRKLRRLEEAGGYRWHPSDSAHLEADLEHLFALMRGSLGEKRHFLTPEREHFFRGIAAELGERQMLRLFFLEVGDERVAAALVFDYANTRLLYNSGYNTAYASLSVGFLLTILCMKEAIQHGLGYFDFLRGNEPYKYHLGAQDVKLHRLLVRRG